MPDTPTLLFAHANGFPGGSYRSLLAPLAERFDVQPLDRLGHHPDFPVGHNWLALRDEYLESTRHLAGPFIGVGHSMGGHGALTVALKNPGRFRSVSAFAPIVNPMNCPWGQKAFTSYLGEDQTRWRQYDACELVANGASRQRLLIDQGEADQFLEEQLMPERLEAVCAEHDHPLTLRRQPGYDHSYFFIASFIEDHLRYHAEHLMKR